MIAAELITDETPPLKVTDTGLKAMAWMEEFKVAHLPVIKKNEYLGLISDADILDVDNPELQIKKLDVILPKPFVFASMHIYEVLRMIAELKLSVVPVLDEQEHYLGVINIHHLIKVISKTAAIESPGGIIVLQMGMHDYSMSEIARLVEGNDAKILSSYLTSNVDSMQLEVTIKVNVTDLTRIIQTFNRYEYNIKASYHENRFGDDLRARYEAFMNFLNL
jgi:CBS domain-containing protein